MSTTTNYEFNIGFDKGEHAPLTSKEWLDQAETCVLGVKSHFKRMPQSEKTFLDLASTLISTVRDNLETDKEMGLTYENEDSLGLANVTVYRHTTIENQAFNRNITPYELLEYSKENIGAIMDTYNIDTDTYRKLNSVYVQLIELQEYFEEDTE